MPSRSRMIVISTLRINESIMESLQLLPRNSANLMLAAAYRRMVSFRKVCRRTRTRRDFILYGQTSISTELDQLLYLPICLHAMYDRLQYDL